MSLALYRSYRPGRLDDVVGQEHVTGPLRRALENDRIHHAYLFGGPRGCGKTSTARILARSLNCERGPTPDPCGECQSCLDLAPNGPGSIDVIELDAASHGGVEDTRDLRERAMFAPAASRYKVYIIDEAHMVTPQGFNALLKLIEEPPPHVRFVFATTEVEKVLPTIRSRTHNYTFRLVPARTLQQHLAHVCESEGVTAEPAALSLVARAGAGSVRDSLSVLGQLIAGAGPDGLTYATVVEQLGVTDAALLDATVAALADEDGAALFSVVDRVVEAGHDPRRFVTDLLERLRDLIVLEAVPDAADSGLLDLPDDRLATMRTHADRLGLAALSRAADLVSHGLSELRGATAPRLQLELLCARLLLPAADDDSRGVAARLDRLERRLAALGPGATVAEASASVPPAATPTRPAPAPEGADPATTRDAAPESAATAVRAAPPRAPRVAAPPPLSEVAPSTDPSGPPPRPVSMPSSQSSEPAAAEDPAPAPAAASPAAASPAAAGPSIGEVTALWPAVLDVLKGTSRVAWMTMAQSTPLSIDGGVLAVGLPAQGTVIGARKGGHDERLRQAVLDVLRVDVRIDIVLAPGAAAPGGATAAPGSSPEPGAEAPAGGPGTPDTDAATTIPDSPAPAPDEGSRRRRAASAAVAAEAAAAAAAATVPDEPSPDDPDADGQGLSAVELAERELGAVRIGEIEAG